MSAITEAHERLELQVTHCITAEWYPLVIVNKVVQRWPWPVLGLATIC